MNQRILSIFGSMIMGLGIGLMSCQTEHNTPIDVYPLLTDALQSAEYRVHVNESELFVEKLERFDVPIHTAHCAIVEGKSAEVSIMVNEQITSFVISPQGKQIPGTVDHNTLRFTIDEPGYFVITVNEQEYLFVIIDTLSKNKPELSDDNVKNVLDFDIDKTGKVLSTELLQKAIYETAETGKTLYFPTGTYLTGQLNLCNNTRIHLDPGAQIKASTNPADFLDKALIHINEADNVNITGHGTIDGSGWTGLRSNGAAGNYLVLISGSRNISLDGIVLRDPCFWNTRVYRSSDVHLKNLKILNNRPVENWTNTDGVDFDSSTDCSLINAIMHCGDDNLVVKGLDSDRLYTTQNILFEKAVVVTNSAATKIGTETCVEYFRNIHFKDIDVVKCKRGMVINAYDSARIEQIVFENIRIEKFELKGVEVPHVIDFEITDQSWRPCTGNCRIEDVIVKNLNVLCDISLIESQMIGKSNEYSINNVSISGCVIEGISVVNAKDLNLITNDFVFGLKISP